VECLSRGIEVGTRGQALFASETIIIIIIIIIIIFTLPAQMVRQGDAKCFEE
jgi:hypothetical protein